jgi:hypothetical protein
MPGPREEWIPRRTSIPYCVPATPCAPKIRSGPRQVSGTARGRTIVLRLQCKMFDDGVLSLSMRHYDFQLSRQPEPIRSSDRRLQRHANELCAELRVVDRQRWIGTSQLLRGGKALPGDLTGGSKDLVALRSTGLYGLKVEFPALAGITFITEVQPCSVRPSSAQSGPFGIASRCRF